MARVYGDLHNPGTEIRYLPQGNTYRADISHTSKGAAKQGVEILGHADVTIVVTRVVVANPGSAMTFQIDATSSALTGGTGSTITPGKFDSNQPASKATVHTFETTAPTGGGTSRFVAMPALTVATNQVLEEYFNEYGTQGVVIRGATEGLTITHQTDAVAYKGYIEWLELYDESN